MFSQKRALLDKPAVAGGEWLLWYEVDYQHEAPASGYSVKLRNPLLALRNFWRDAFE